MILRVDHVAIAVRDYDSAYAFFTKLLGAVPGSGSDDSQMKYYWQNLCLGDLSRLELLSPTGEGSFLDNFLAKKHGGVHHITMQTSDIYSARNFLEKHDIPYFGFQDYGKFWKELFIHPRDAFGVLIQIAEFNADDWIAPELRMPEKQKYEISKSNNSIVIGVRHPGGGKVHLELDETEAIQLCNDIQKLVDVH